MEEQKRGRGRPRKNPLVAPVVKTKKVKAELVPLEMKEDKEDTKPKNKVSNKKGTVVVEAEQDGTGKEKGYSVQLRGGKAVKVEDTDEVE